MKFFLILSVVLILIVIILILIIIKQNRKIKTQSESIKSIILVNKNLHYEIERLNNVDKIKSDNRRETNEKLDELHNGDSVNNAINVLCDNKNK